MKMKITLLVVITILISSCSSTRIYNLNSPDISFNEFNSKYMDFKGSILLSDGQTFNAYRINVSRDSTYWIKNLESRQYIFPEKYIPNSIATSRIKEITFKNRGKGLVHGLGWGILGGAFLGYFTGLVSYEGSSEFSRSYVGALTAIFYGIPSGAIIGAISGAAIGSKETYLFRVQSDSSSLVNDKTIQ